MPGCNITRFSMLRPFKGISTTCCSVTSPASCPLVVFIRGEVALTSALWVEPATLSVKAKSRCWLTSKVMSEILFVPNPAASTVTLYVPTTKLENVNIPEPFVRED
jgi:hypothetical protein